MYKERILKIDAKIKLLKIKMETKSKMKNVSLGTSKTNYIDPRLIIAWTKTFDIDPSYIYTKTLLTKFQWAIQITTSEWNWENDPIRLIGDTLEPSKQEGDAVEVSIKTSSKKSKIPTKRRKVPFKPAIRKRREEVGTLDDYKLLFVICSNPIQNNLAKVARVSTDALKWLYPFCKYAVEKGIKKPLNNFFMDVYKNRVGEY